MSRTKSISEQRSPTMGWSPWGTGLALLVVLAGPMACNDEGLKSVVSTEVATGEISAQHYVYRLGDGRLEALSRLRLTWECAQGTGCVRDTPFVELVEPDQMSISCGAVTASYEPVIEDSMRLVYEAQTASSTDATQVRIVLERATGPVTFVAELPEPFEILAPAPGATFSRADGFQMQVSRELTSVYIWGECIQDWTRLSWPLGSLYDFVAGPFETADGYEGESCDVTIQAYRSRDGVLDPAVDPDTSSMEVSQKRVLQVTLTP